MVNQEFCDFLEYQITKALKHLDKEDIKGFWCDGVLLGNCSQKIIKEDRCMMLKAFIGRDGQTEYDLKLKFGNKALALIERNLDITACLPAPTEPNWFSIDTKRNKVEVQLD